MQRPQLDWKKDSNVNGTARVRSTYNPTTEPLYKSTSPIEGKQYLYFIVVKYSGLPLKKQ